MVDRTDVKINQDYTYLVDAADPTTAENTAAGFHGGETWLNMTSGESFQLVDPDAGQWKQIEEALDVRIDRMLRSRGFALFKLTGDYFYRFRQESLDDIDDDVPDSIDRFCLDRLTRYVSLYADWTVTKGTGETDIQADSIVGEIADIAVGDTISILGSKRMDGLYTVTTVTTDTITVNREIESEVDMFLVLLVHPNDDFDEVVGRMLWFDLTVRNARGGLGSERIGTYSWTAGPQIGGLGYPEDVAAGFLQYMSVTPLGTADYIP